MAYTDIDKPTDYFNTKLYTGTGATHNITGVGFQPDFVWLKKRSAIKDHSLNDSVRGAGKDLICNETFSEQNDNVLTSFDSDGFTLSSETRGNESSSTYASWSWLGGGTASSNTDGSITSSVSANQDAGFSIVSYTGNGTGGATVGHNLSSVPHMYIVKRRDVGSSNWHVYHQGIGATKGLRLNLTNAENTTDIWQDTAPTSSVFSLGSSIDVNASGGSYIAYCFAEKKGYSKFGSYTGNGNADGTFVYTGFKPAWVLCKQSSGSGYGWTLFDNKRAGYNQNNYTLQPDGSAGENTGGGNGRIDLLSNGFKQRSTDAGVNGNGSTYIYMAFAENPFVTSTGVPATAR